jgi:hypothetical protein
MASHPNDPHDAGVDDPIWEAGPAYMASDRPLARRVARPVREFLRVEAAGGTDRLGSVGGFADDVDIVGQVQDGAKPEPDEVLVVDEEQPDTHAATSLFPRVFAA